MDAERVDIDSLSLTTPMVHWAPAAFGVKLARVYNDACSAACIVHPRRLIGMAVLPTQAPDLALQELERAAKLPGLRGLYLGTHINKQNLDEKTFFPIYAKCGELRWAIFLHPAATVAQLRAHLSAAKRELILGRTAARLLKL